MSKRKIKNLPTLTNADDLDLLPIVDIDEPILENQTKKISVQNLLSGLGNTNAPASGEPYVEIKSSSDFPTIASNANNSMAIGPSTTVGSTCDTALVIGFESGISFNGDSSIVIGSSSNVTEGEDDDYECNDSIAIGHQAVTVHNYNVAIGYRAEAGGYSSGGSRSIAIGKESKTFCYDSISIGSNVTTGEGYSDNSIGIGSNISKNSVSLFNSVAIGSEIQIGFGGEGGAGEESVAIGTNINNSADRSITIGKNSVASLDAFDGIALGTNSSVISNGAVQIGEGQNNNQNTLAFRDHIIADSEGLYTSFETSTNYTPININNLDSHLQAIDIALNNTGGGVGNPYIDISYTGTLPSADSNSIAIGENIETYSNTIAIGSNILKTSSTFSGLHIGIGRNINFGGDGGEGNILMGLNTISGSGDNQIVIGHNANGGGGGASITIGDEANSNGPSSIAIGQNASNNSSDSIALGFNSSVTSDGAVQIGEGENNNENTLAFRGNLIASIDGLFIAETFGTPSTVLQSGTPRWDSTTGILYISNGTSWLSTTLT